MQCAENATEQEDDGFQDDRAVGGRRANKSETGEQQGDDGGGGGEGPGEPGLDAHQVAGGDLGGDGGHPAEQQ